MSEATHLGPWTRALLRFGRGECEVDLREPVPSPARAAFRRLGLEGPFAVVTPCNPEGRIIDDTANAQRLGAAKMELTSRGLEGVPTTCADRDGTHLEPGWALPIAREEAVALAIGWQQAGLYWWDESQFWILPALGEWRELRLPVQAAG